ncbi:hypothetical protein F4802DRAFT_562975 [Xylaria palmicola]|nr:hypothetical protein F4802DRAFT_562975 [Xylaria palmicola]
MGAHDDSWFRPELKSSNNGIGDAYDDDTYYKLVREWTEDVTLQSTGPYMNWVRNLSESGWIHLRLLTDFMLIGAAPQRWGDLDPKRGPEGLNTYLTSPGEIERRKEERRRRIAKTKVYMLDYHALGNEVKTQIFTSARELNANLAADITDGIKFRLYVVEDLSRDVIEAFGQKFKIEPDLFRSHVADFAWSNVLDRSHNPPLLDIVSRHQNWMQLRYVTARYFDTTKAFLDAAKEADNFNILRRLDDDLSNKSHWDKKGAIVGLTRSRATFWLKPTQDDSIPVGILFLDPTVTKGVPLWRGRRILWPTPTDGQTVPPKPPQDDNLFENFVFWAQQTNLSSSCTPSLPSEALLPMQVLLHFVCSEWSTISSYIKTRLNQLNWEVTKPDLFGYGKKGANEMLEKLHMWRRLVPLYREMVSETIQHIDRFSDQMQQLTTASNSSPSKTDHSLIDHYRVDLQQIKSQLEEYQSRFDQLTAVVTAVISINNSQRSLQDNRNIGRLTWLATLFIPLSLIAGILSMQPSVSDISQGTFKVYFATSLPLGAVIAFATLILSWSRSETRTNLKALQRTLQGVWPSKA